ncbi:hypothetical protein [Thermotalea metallivorans]|uniref:Uncharacterized protein n=1 Tax=Thermotalea metallivorans TaxID=520762 RepID=A0A140LDM4_9FIRM|nr:hypothetical protein [Thermotalea metallivorans]KXG78649.1 hypothetical protein AN619_01750 [Thermotalea metallivorans]
MREEGKERKDLVELCRLFIELMDCLKDQGIIDPNEYMKHVAKKKKFLHDFADEGLLKKERK